MTPARQRAYEILTGVLPPHVAGRVDLLRPSFRDSWGGPLNGQERRREIVEQLALRIPFDRVVEAGTYRGTTTEYLSSVFDAAITTVEVNPRYFTYSRRRLAPLHNVTVTFGDSRRILQELAAAPSAPDGSIFVYLDSHGEVELPLSDELEIIASGWTRAIVMVDDFMVPGDDGYVYMEDYGPDMALSEDRLPFHALRGWTLFYPAAPSMTETGSRRGCCVLASPALAEAAAVPGLRVDRVV